MSLPENYVLKYILKILASFKSLNESFVWNCSVNSLSQVNSTVLRPFWDFRMGSLRKTEAGSYQLTLDAKTRCLGPAAGNPGRPIALKAVGGHARATRRCDHSEPDSTRGRSGAHPRAPAGPRAGGRPETGSCGHRRADHTHLPSHFK